MQELREFRECGSVLYIAAHPDDENTQFIAYMAKERAMRVGYLSLTRGEGGQDLIGPELGDPLGVIRTQELLAARRIDGGQQFFTRAKDFGFSKVYEQTLAKWDRQGVLSDVVRVIRTFQPDVIVTRFPPEPGGTHGHHTASHGRWLWKPSNSRAIRRRSPRNSRETSFRSSMASLATHAFSGTPFAGIGNRPTLRLDIGGYLPLLGLSVGEISALSRSSHRSQGYGSVATRGSREDDFHRSTASPSARTCSTASTLLEPLAGRGGGWQTVDEIIARFDPQNPAASVPALLALRRPSGPRGLSAPLGKRRQSRPIIQDCLGLYVETTVPQAEVVPGETLEHASHGGPAFAVPVRWQAVIPIPASAGTIETWTCRPSQPVTRDTSPVARPAKPSERQPYWLREEGTPGMYRVEGAFAHRSPRESARLLPRTHLRGVWPISDGARGTGTGHRRPGQG